ncbi:MAG: T9SS type A sorting domain-containing protein [Bacteroidia bacterium]|nr:T9SS type A sorting domain-containing protein [Bacteroidia bacterium]
MKTKLKKITLFLMLIFMVNINYGQPPLGCDNFETYNWQPTGDTLGYTQSGNYPIINVPYFDTASTLGTWEFNQNFPGIYGAYTGANFSFNGSAQVITYEIYGGYSQFNQMGFSVNGSSTSSLNGGFPITIGGIVVNLDTTATNFSNWENVYLSFSGNVNEIEIYCFESGILQMCVDSLDNTPCNDFTTYNWQPNGDTLGYTQGGIYPIINVPYFDTASTLGTWEFNQNFPGIYGSYTGANFSFDGSTQVITYEIYGGYSQFNQMGFSVNGSTTIALNASFPTTIGGVIVNLDTTATNFSNWENVYLSFTGNVNEIEIYCFESGILQICVDPQNVNTISEYNNIYDINVYPNPASNNITIVNKSKIEQNFNFSLMNIQGQQIVNDQINFASSHNIDVSGLSNGVYILSLHNNKINYVSRVVIQKD